MHDKVTCFYFIPRRDWEGERERVDGIAVPSSHELLLNLFARRIKTPAYEAVPHL